MDERTAELVARIREVFWDVPRGKMTLYKAAALDLDPYYMSPEDKELSAIERKQHWSEVSDATVQKCVNGILLLNPADFRFYLPRLLIFNLDEPPGSSGNVWEMIDFIILTAPREERGQCSELLRHERRVVWEYLCWCWWKCPWNYREGIDDAVRQYWAEGKGLD